MKTLLGFLFLIVFPVASFSQYQQLLATTEAMASTFTLQGDALTGTSFLFVRDAKQYFVTAAHLFKPSHKSGDGVAIQIGIQNQLQSINAKVYFHPNRKVDIALVRLSEKVSQKIELPEEFIKYNEFLQPVFQSNGISMDSTLIGFGTHVYFYGFPLGNMGTEAFGIKLPLVKKAIVSGWVKYNEVDVLVLDGHNNAGFSGGPVLAYDSSSQKMCIIGVISGYFPERKNIEYKGDNLWFNENSGIIVCYGRHYIDEIFIKNKKELLKER